MVDPALGVLEYAMKRKDKDLRRALQAAKEEFPVQAPNAQQYSARTETERGKPEVLTTTNQCERPSDAIYGRPRAGRRQPSSCYRPSRCPQPLFIVIPNSFVVTV
jgi:hypothetical protein